MTEQKRQRYLERIRFALNAKDVFTTKTLRFICGDIETSKDLHNEEDLKFICQYFESEKV